MVIKRKSVNFLTKSGLCENPGAGKDLNQIENCQQRQVLLGDRV